MSERARHRADLPPSTPLRGLSMTINTAIGDNTAALSRTGMIVAVSSGLVAGVGLPAGAVVRAAAGGAPQTASVPLLTESASTTALAAGADVLASAPVTASAQAKVTFEHDAFTAQPKRGRAHHRRHEHGDARRRRRLPLPRAQGLPRVATRRGARPARLVRVAQGVVELAVGGTGPGAQERPRLHGHRDRDALPRHPLRVRRAPRRAASTAPASPSTCSRSSASRSRAAPTRSTGAFPGIPAPRPAPATWSSTSAAGVHTTSASTLGGNRMIAAPHTGRGSGCSPSTPRTSPSDVPDPVRSGRPALVLNAARTGAGVRPERRTPRHGPRASRCSPNRGRKGSAIRRTPLYSAFSDGSTHPSGGPVRDAVRSRVAAHACAVPPRIAAHCREGVASPREAAPSVVLALDILPALQGVVRRRLQESSGAPPAADRDATSQVSVPNERG